MKTKPTIIATYRKRRLLRGSTVVSGRVGRTVLINLCRFEKAKRERGREREREKKDIVQIFLSLSLFFFHQSFEFRKMNVRMYLARSQCTYKSVKLAQLESKTSTPLATLLTVKNPLLNNSNSQKGKQK